MNHTIIIMKTLVAFMCVLVVSPQVKGDALDDLREQYGNELKALAAGTDNQVADSEHTLMEADLYMTHATEVFIADGETKVTNRTIQVNETAAQLTLDAITNNKPVSVLTCISNQREKGATNLAKLLPPYQSALDKIHSDSTSNFVTQKNTIELISSQLSGLLDGNLNKISTCVEETCFTAIIQDATTQYNNINTNVNNIANGVKSSRADFNTKSIDVVHSLRDDSTSATDAALKALGKC